MPLPEPEEHGKSIFASFWLRNMTGFPLVLKIERAVTEIFLLQIWIRDGRIDQGTFGYGHPGQVSRLLIWWAKKYSRLFFRLSLWTWTRGVEPPGYPLGLGLGDVQ